MRSCLLKMTGKAILMIPQQYEYNIKSHANIEVRKLKTIGNKRLLEERIIITRHETSTWLSNFRFLALSSYAYKCL